MSRRYWIATGLVAFFVLVAAAFSTKELDAHYNSEQTILRARYVLQSCEVYRGDPASGGKYPVALLDLHKRPSEGKSFLPDGDSDLLDMWGNPYRYAVIANAHGEQEVYVWAERVVRGKLKLLGAKRNADGGIELFGLEK
ncbi:hypothetical protein VT84_25000 [Gemmata sp. SH-PL17]|uniref:hypothetical protein n=1 Tax=Gemmata sp. SH-PL17 TaxID=1630693 RepID=UPI0004B56636|nr:hypothetical protein [Gemmata sp. SH-PL17]AMV27683.1 hypothetical protein VT84_25000 [Gemmata sp. SH-PL17]